MTGAAPVSVDGNFMVSGYPQAPGDGVKEESTATSGGQAQTLTNSSPVGAVDSEGQSEVMEEDADKAARIAELNRLLGK
jgi:hypothetical protein